MEMTEEQVVEQMGRDACNRGAPGYAFQDANFTVFTKERHGPELDRLFYAWRRGWNRAQVEKKRKEEQMNNTWHIVGQEIQALSDNLYPNGEKQLVLHFCQTVRMLALVNHKEGWEDTLIITSDPDRLRMVAYQHAIETMRSRPAAKAPERKYRFSLVLTLDAVDETDGEIQEVYQCLDDATVTLGNRRHTTDSMLHSLGTLLQQGLIDTESYNLFEKQAEHWIQERDSIHDERDKHRGENL